ncbi:hypothetical protein N9383_04850 [Granulosicoccus sp.]|nr:hypothetical protein [Granulosicoccus sp.]
MNKPIPPELISEIERLDEEGVARVLAYAKSLSTSDTLQARNERLRKLVGSIPKEDLEQMRVAINEGCEQVEQTGW